MGQLTGVERISGILSGKPVDRIGFCEHFWNDTLRQWRRDGKLGPSEELPGHFGYDLEEAWVFDLRLRRGFQDVVIAEDEETVTLEDGNFAWLRRHKNHDTTPEHIKFAVACREDWETLAKPRLQAAPERINLAAYRDLKAAAAANRFFCWSGVNVFESIHPICGHENLLMGMGLDPEWIADMADTYAELWIQLMEILLAEGGKPDGVWFYEDMGFKERPFMSPAMYRELIFPAHRRTIDFAHANGLPVIMHSCGFVEPLLPGMIEAGIDCLQAIEVKAGMDVLRIHREFGDRIALCGGLDTRNLVANDWPAIDRELEEKIPVLKGGKGYILHSDHSIPETCSYDTYRHFAEKGLALGRYGK